MGKIFNLLLIDKYVLGGRCPPYLLYTHKDHFTVRLLDLAISRTTAKTGHRARLTEVSKTESAQPPYTNISQADTVVPACCRGAQSYRCPYLQRRSQRCRAAQ